MVRAGLLATAIAAACSLAGCGGEGKEAPAPGVIVDRVLQRASGLESYHFVLKVDHAPSGPGLTLTLADGDLLMPDRLRARINGTFGRVPIQSEIVIAGGRSFLRDPLTGQWRRFATGTDPGAFVRDVPAVLRRAVGLRNAGFEKVGGADAYRLSGRARAADVAALVAVTPGRDPVPFSVWVDEQRYLLLRIRLEGPVGDKEPSDIVRTVELSAFDEPVSITTPTVSG